MGGLPIATSTLLQKVKDNTPAKGVTAKEFADHMTGIRMTVIQRLSTPEWAARWEEQTGGTPDECPPIYSFDNPSIHTTYMTGMRALGLVDAAGKPTDAWLQLPPHSGDLHRTIERVHARICGAFQAWFNEMHTEYHIFGYCKKLLEIFVETQTPHLIQECMHGPRGPISSLYARVVELRGAPPPERNLR